MNLKNLEAFRSWLIRQLEPVCKANPEPVSKYVCALLKKEKSDGDLKNSLISHLYIFLDSMTEEFVNFLIDALENDKYEKGNMHFKPSELCDTNVKDGSKSDEVSDDNELDSISLGMNDPPELNVPSPDRREISPPVAPKKDMAAKTSPPKKLNTRSEKRHSTRNSSGSNLSAAGRKRVPSGSSDDSIGSPRRSWASKPPDSKRYKHRYSGRLSPQNTRSNSPKYYSRRGRNANFSKQSRNNSHSKSAGGERAKLNSHRPSYPNDRSSKFEMDLHSVQPVYEGNQRCADFENKGFCARGDTCPFDHGPAPIVLSNNILTPYVHLPPPVHGPIFQPPPPQHPSPAMFPPPPHFAASQNFPKEAFQPDSRELIPVPTVPLSRTKKPQNSKPSYGHVFSSLPPGVSQTSIELTNVPADKNNIPTLYETFSKFGNITLIQAKRNNDLSVALLTFTNATEAALAFINVSSAMENVKAAWYADKCILKPFPRKLIPAGAAHQTYTLNRQNPAGPAQQANNDVASLKTPAFAQSPAKKSLQEESAQRPEDRKPDPAKMLSDLTRKKRELLTKQLDSRKQILQKIKSLETGSEEEKTWRDVLQKLDSVIRENQKGYKESLKQKKEYLQKLNPQVQTTKAVGRHAAVSNGVTGTPPLPVTAPVNVAAEIADVETTEDHVLIDVSGFENGDETNLLAHFSQFGKIVDKQFDTTIPSAKFVYECRKSAEDAKRLGKVFEDRVLAVTIINKKLASSPRKPIFKHLYGGNNRYKYKNPKLINTAPSPRLAEECPSVPTADTCGGGSGGVKAAETQDEFAVDNSQMKFTEEEDLVTFLQKGGIDAKVVEKYMD